MRLCSDVYRVRNRKYTHLFERAVVFLAFDKVRRKETIPRDPSVVFRAWRFNFLEV